MGEQPREMRPPVVSVSISTCTRFGIKLTESRSAAADWVCIASTATTDADELRNRVNKSFYLVVNALLTERPEQVKPIVGIRP